MEKPSTARTAAGLLAAAAVLTVGLVPPVEAKGPRGSSGRYAAQARSEGSSGAAAARSAAPAPSTAAAPAGPARPAMSAAPSSRYRSGYGYGHGSSHLHWGVALGVPIWLGSMYYPATHVVITTRPGITYIEKDAAGPDAPEYYWYYCPDSRIYYPYAEQCASPWQPVVPAAAGPG